MPADANVLCAEYLARLATGRRLSPLTVASYRRDLALLLQLKGDAPLTELRAHHVRRFVAQLHGRGLSGRSLARILSAWRGFFRHLAREHALDGFELDPCAGVRPPKSPRRLPNALSPDEAARLMELDDASWLALRDKAMLELFYSSGLRLAELVGLPLARLDLRDGEVTVVGKGGKTRIVPVGRQAQAALHAWLSQREALAAPGETALFVGRNGKALSPRAVQYRLKYWALRLGLPSDVHPHVLRHSFASHVLQSSGDLRAVQEMLGHASITSTQVYTHLDFQHLAKVYDAAHPRARKRS